MKASVVTTNAKSFEVDFDLDNKIMILRFYGVIDLKDMIDSLSTGIRHQEFEYNMSACCDFSQATVDVEMSAAEVIFHFLTGLREKRGDEYHLALVYSDEITKTLMDYYRLAFSRSKIDVELFQSFEAARNWIITNQQGCEVTYLDKN